MPVCLTQAEEEEFLTFLRNGADIRIIVPFAGKKEDLFRTDFGPHAIEDQFYIWNRSFPWQPEYAQTRDDLPDASRRNIYYVSNKSDAPLFEYSRERSAKGGMPGRVYWAKDFAAPNGLDYDVKAFEVWFETVRKFLRKIKARRS